MKFLRNIATIFITIFIFTVVIGTAWVSGLKVIDMITGGH